MTHEDSPFLVREAVEESHARCFIAVERTLGQMILRDIVTLVIAKNTYKCEIDGICESKLDRRVAVILPFLEVVEHVHAAAGEERFTWARGICPLHGGVEHRLQAAIAGPCHVRQ